MTDWAKTAAQNLTDSYWNGPGKSYHMSVSEFELVEALRRAKADGAREAGKIFVSASIFKSNGAPLTKKSILNWVENRANAIEKGTE